LSFISQNYEIILNANRTKEKNILHIINALYDMHQIHTQNLSITRKNDEKLPTMEGGIASN